jgi:hypothetical protein
MKSSRARSALWIAVTLFSATLLLPMQAAGKSAGKGGKSKPAKAAKPKSESGSSSLSSSITKPSTPYEVPGPAPSTETATATSTSTSTDTSSSTGTSTETSTSTETATQTSSSSTEPSKVATSESAPSTPSITLSQETTIPPVEDTAPAEPAPIWVEHLGPETYPGKLRGLYGGSLWLEPSFHGLQWPYMKKTGVGVSGVFWVDSGYEKIVRDAKPTIADTSMFLQQGRGLLRVTPTYTNGNLFIQAQVELIGNLCQASGSTCLTNGTVDTDDLWIRFGQWNAWDIKVGRFEAWELYHTGMGLDINTQERLGAHNGGLTAPAGLNAPDFYGMNWMHDRPSDGLGVGYLAFHAYPTETIRFEVLGEMGASDVTSLGYTYYGGRPSIILDYGWLKLKAGYEYEKRQGDQSFVDTSTDTKSASKAWRTRQGFGGCVLFVIDPRAEFGGSLAMGKQESHENFQTGDLQPTDSFSRNSVGGFANLRLGSLWLVGGGANFTWQNDKYYHQNADSPNYTAHLQAFGAIQYLLARQLYIRAVFGYARADFVASDDTIPVWSNTMMSGRIRLMYLY